jgi:hypothetical protein
MNYPVVAKKAFKRLRFSAHEVWQNLRELKKNITSLVRNIDDMGSCLSRSRHLVQGLTGVESACMRGESRKNAAAAETAHCQSPVSHNMWGPYVSGGET